VKKQGCGTISLVMPMMPMTLEELRQWLVSELPKWLREHPELRYTLEGVLAETFVRRDEWQNLMRALEKLAEGQQELQRTLQEVLRQQAEHSQALRALQEQQAEHSRTLQEHSRILQEHTQALRDMQKQLAEHSEAIRSLQEEQVKHSELLRRLDAKIGALGRRWGLLSEAAFREGMYELLTPYGFRVERFWARDEEGFVFGRPEQIEIDLLVRNEATIAAEIRSSVSKADVWVFLRKVEFLERLLNRKIDRKAIISPFVDDDALEFAQKTGVEVFTAPEELRSG
jgi:Uncharacterized conserved protein containing a coiled-coil domain, COG5493